MQVRGKSVIMRSPDPVCGPPLIMASLANTPVPADSTDFMLHPGLTLCFSHKIAIQSK